MNINRLNKLCYRVHWELEAFKGNCGSFAIALAKFVGEENCQFVIAENTDYDGCGCYHVAIKYKDRLFDGRGFTTAEKVEAYAFDEESGESQLVTLPVDEGTIWHVIRYTDSEDQATWEKFLEIFNRLDKTLQL